jgi:hypothetical protein
MLRFRIFRLPTAKKYNYIPVYYDERKEKNKGNIDSNETSYKDRIKGSFRKTQISRKRNSDTTKSNIRLLIIIAILTMLAIYLLYF